MGSGYIFFQFMVRKASLAVSSPASLGGEYKNQYFTSHTTRTTLIIMKLISAAAAAALFFSSEAETPDSDPECEQPEELWREMVQNFTVGVLSAFLGDAVIFFVFRATASAEAGS